MKKNLFRLICVVFVFVATSCQKEGPVELVKPAVEQPVAEAVVESARVATNVVETLPPVLSAITANITTNCGGYYRALPARYDSTTQKYPLLIFLHGKSALGNGSAAALPKIAGGPITQIKRKTFPANFKVNNQNFSYIVIAPQFKAWPTGDDVDAIVKYFVTKLRVDPARIYVTGLSMGGGATWDYAGKYAAKIAAVAPVCGASSPTDAKAKVMADNKLPVWAFHNKDDRSVTVNNSIGWVNKINAYKPAPAAKLTLWATGGHDAWTKAYTLTYKENNLNVYEWLLQYKR